MLMHMQDWCARHGAPYYELSRLGSLVLTHQPLSGPASTASTYGRSEVFCGRIPGATVFGDHGFVWTQDGCVLAHGLSHRNYLHAQLVPEEIKRYAPQRGAPTPRIEEECVFFGGAFAPNKPNFGHFIFQHLLKLHAIRQIPEAARLPLAVYRDVPPRHLEFLDLAGYPDSRRIYVDHDRPVSFANVWVPSTPFYRGHYNDRQAYLYPDAVFGLRDLMMDRTRIAAAGARPRIYVPRTNAQWRRVVNDGEVLALLQSYGFTVARMEEMSAAEQIDLVSRAEMIAMDGGASSPITMFAPPDCIVFEFVNRHIVGTFGAIAFGHILGFIIQRIVGEDAPAPELEGRPMIDMNYRVPISVLATALDAAANLVSRRRRDAEERRRQICAQAPDVDAA
jgi:capsular polysaccharide biosynthesis protein